MTRSHQIATLTLALSLLTGCTWVRGRWPVNKFWPPADIVEPPAAAAPAAAPAAPATRPAAPAAVTTRAATAPASRPSAYSGYDLLGQPRVVQAAMLMVNDQVISVDEVLRMVRRPMEAIPRGISEQTFVSQARGIVSDEIQRQVAEVLVYGEASQKLSDAQKEHIESTVESALREQILAAGGSRTALERRLVEEGTSLDEALVLLRRQKTSQFYLRQRLIPQISVSGKSLWRYYQKHTDEFTTPRKVQMQVAAFPYRRFYPAGRLSATEAELTAAKQQAAAAAAAAMVRIKAEEDFGEVVRSAAPSVAYRSEQGGMWDYMAAGNFREKRVEDAAFAAKVGQVSGPIEGETGVFIVKTIGIQRGKVTSFEDAQEAIDMKLRDAQYTQLRMDYYQELYRKASIVQAEAFEKLLLVKAVQMYHRP